MTTSTEIAVRTTQANGLATADEWNAIVAQANTLALTEIVPKPFRGKPHDIVAVAMIGRELGLSPMMAMQYIHVIDGKPAMSAELMNAKVRTSGHRITLVELTVERCIIEGERRDTGEIQRAEFTMEDADRAELTKLPSSGKNGNWQKVPKAMLWARTVSMLCRMLFPDVIAGASYVPEELGAEVDEDGVPLAADAPSTALPPEMARAATRPAEVDAEDVDVIDEEPRTAPATYAQPGDAAPVDGAGGFAQPTPPPPLTPHQEHMKVGDDLFKYGWPAKGRSGDLKGKSPNDVGNDDLQWFSEQTSRDPKYAAMDEKRRQWCRVELDRRTPPAATTPPPAKVDAEPMTQQQQDELFALLVQAGHEATEARALVAQTTAASQQKTGVYSKAIDRVQRLLADRAIDDEAVTGEVENDDDIPWPDASTDAA